MDISILWIIHKDKSLLSGFPKKQNRQSLYTMLFLYLCVMKTLYLIFLVLFFFQISIIGNNAYLWKPIDKTCDLLGVQLEEAICQDGEPIKSHLIIRRMYQIAEEKGNSTLLARALYWKSWEQLKMNQDSAEYFIEKALTKVDSVNFEYDHARLLFNLGTILINQGDYPRAYHLYKKLESYFKTVNDHLFTGKTCINIAYILNGIQEYQKSLTYLQKADTHLRKGGHIKQATKNQLNVANLLFWQNKKRQAVQIFHSLLENEVTQEDSVFLVSVIVALDYTSTNKEEKRKYSRKAYEIAKLIQNKNCLMYTLMNLGAYYSTYETKYDSALACYKQAYTYSLTNNDAHSITHILHGLSANYARINQTDSAYHYLKAYIICKDSLTGNDKIIEINKQEGRIAIEKYELELRQAQEKTLWHKKITIVITLSIICLSALVCYVFWLLRKKEKMKKQLKETENRELNEHLRNETLLNEKFQTEIDFKNRELTSTTLVITEKNQTLKTLQKQIEKLGQEGVLPNKYGNALQMEIKNHLADGDEWQYFKLHFESVHPDFFLKLKQKFPILSENELYLCAYIRIGMNTKQMAQMLSVLPETVNMARYRMRKKMKLTQEESLENFLRAF